MSYCYLCDGVGVNWSNVSSRCTEHPHVSMCVQGAAAGHTAGDGEEGIQGVVRGREAEKEGRRHLFMCHV